MRKVLTYFVFPVVIILLAYLLYRSISEPVKFQNELKQRSSVAIERLKDIRTLQTTYKSAFNVYAPCMDTLIDFYNNGKIDIVKQIGSTDDSVAVAHTNAIKRRYGKKASEEFLYDLYLKGDKNLIIKIPVPIAVKDTLFHDRSNFNVEDLRYIPFADGDTIIMATAVKTVSGVPVPLFEAKIPYGARPAPGSPFRGLLAGMNEQLIINLNAEREDTNRYPGLMVGSIDSPNNNAGNWE